MRQIKFRAWDGKRMFTNIQDAYDTLEDDPNTDVDCFGSYLDNDSYKVMQYTGLTDCHGKEIWEGDIVKSEHPPNFIVCWNEGGAFFDLATKDDDENTDDRLLSEYTLSQFKLEVIGNTYSNPELLNG